MTDELDNTPDWIKRQKREKAEEKRQAKEDLQAQLEVSTLIPEKGPDFWKQLVDRIRINVQALKELELEDEQLVGSVSPSGGEAELTCHIQVNRVSVRFGPELSHMNLFYKPGDYRIRCWYQDRDSGDIKLVSARNEVLAIDDGSAPKTAAQLADNLVEGMAVRVRAKRLRR